MLLFEVKLLSRGFEVEDLLIHMLDLLHVGLHDLLVLLYNSALHVQPV